jgi:hypothetical protein
MFRLRSMQAFPLSGGTKVERNLMRISLRNDTRLTIRNSVLIHMGYPYFAGDLEPGQTLEETFRTTYSTELPNAEIPWDDIIPREAADAVIKRDILKTILVEGGWSNLRQSDRVVLAGWLEEDLLPASTNRQFFRHSRLTLVAVVFDPNGENVGFL